MIAEKAPETLELSGSAPEAQPENPLEALAHRLAGQYSAVQQQPGKLLMLTRLQGHQQFLTQAYQQFAAAAQQEMMLSYAAEWLLDNFYVVQQTIRQIKEDMPAGYYRRLPKLMASDWKDYPRIYVLAHEIAAFYHSQLDIDGIITFLRTYQADDNSLTMGELWALPTMLRLSILDNLVKTLSRLTRTESSSPAASTAATVPEDMLVGNCITSLRTLASQTWATFFEQVSQVEQILRLDPAGVYAGMDFDTRNNYRAAVEALARQTHRLEEEVAHQLITLCQSAPCPSRMCHVGYYLVDKGRRQFEARLDYRPAWIDALGRELVDHPTLTYLGGIALATLAILWLVMGYAASAGGSVFVLALLALIPAITVAVSLVDWTITNTIPPRASPRLDFQDGIPEQYRTMVVIPTLLTSADEIDSLLQQLELHFLRNTDPQLYFALLTDFADAPNQTMPEDAELVSRAEAGITSLNARYKRDVSPFFLFHRHRRWNASEGCWMGWERKRGKLMEFNRLLRGAETTSYNARVGELSVLPQIRYVITLDADTILPKDSARRLIATLAHPLNQAEYDAAQGRITEGYAILQPRTDIKPTSANQSRFSRIFAGDVGLDLYTRAVSNVYQDFFGEGIYVGKGIYDVNAFEQCLDGRIPENSLLSHDLLEGILAHVGLVTDILLYEDYPAHYLVRTHRLHRWIRGDWQLLPWLLPHHAAFFPANTRPSRLSVLDRWKILDNLRRSLVMPALLILLAAAWLGWLGSPLAWTVFALATLAVPLLLGAFAGLLRSFKTAPDVLRAFPHDALRWLLAVVFLPYEALLALDAIVITLWRLLITRRRLLEWTTAADTARSFDSDSGPALMWRQLLLAPCIAVIVGFVTMIANPAGLPAALPILVLWLISPQVAYWISRPKHEAPETLSADEIEELHLLARQTWLFFEQMVGPEDHWLPPDHFQEAPRGVVAHRTSPTNIGLLLMSTLAAYDLGYTGHLDLIVRLQSSFETINKLERYRGHLFNWYDTQTLDVMPPRYISTVDSGNWAGCLLVLKQVCLAFPNAYVMRPQRWQGLLDTLAMLENILGSLFDNTPNLAVDPLRGYIGHMTRQVQATQAAPEHWTATLSWLNDTAWTELSRMIVELVEAETSTVNPEQLSNLRIATERVNHHLTTMQRDLDLLLPWLFALSQPPALFTDPGADSTILSAWQAFAAAFPVEAPHLSEIGALCESARSRLEHLQSQLQDGRGAADQIAEARSWCSQLAEKLESTRVRIHGLLIGYQDLAAQAEAQFQAMDFSFLFNTKRKLFHIGYNVYAGKLDDNFYDLLASEARLASALAIAKGDIPQAHWLHLGRPVTEVDNRRVLLSWNGTMFEYLMPSLLMANYDNTLLTQSCQMVVDYQIAYARKKNIPWGVSESGYYAFDANMNYQYRAFGVSGLGFKRGLADDLVITPYASLLALSIRPQAVLRNMRGLDRAKLRGRYGFYEAADYTRSRTPARQDHAVIRSFMTHHQGMIMLSVTNYLQHDPIIHYFHADPRVQSIELLLQEKIPQEAPVEYPNFDELTAYRIPPPPVTLAPWQAPADTALPQVHVLSNGRFSTLLTSAGGGSSQWQGTGLTRWQPDTTLDDWGLWIYVQDQDSGTIWSAGYQPTAAGSESGRVMFYPHKVEYQREDQDILLNMEVAVAADDDIEIRQITLINHSDRLRHLRLVSYGEVLLAQQTERHPAFNKLFIESDYLPDQNMLLFHRRLQSANEEPIYVGHLAFAAPGSGAASRERSDAAGRAYEGDRLRFLGRGRTVHAPAALQPGAAELSRTVGATLDPVMVLAQDVALEPHAKTQIAYLTLAAPSQQEATALADRYRAWPMIERAFDSARRQCELELRHLDLGTPELAHIQQLLSGLFYPYAGLRAAPDTLAANSRGQSSLWAYGISGDYPLLLLCINDVTELALVQEALQAHTYWRNQQLMIDLVILNLHDSSYSQELQNQLNRLIIRSNSANWRNRRGGIFVLNADQMNEADRVLLQTAASVTLVGNKGSLAQHLASMRERPTDLPAFSPPPIGPEQIEVTPPLPRPAGLLFDNGWGGFSPDGKEYVVYLEAGHWTPAPWVNVIANPTFGCLVSETGGGYTWSENSSENRLTPWRNDPVSDSPSEALYLRDEESAQVWSPTPLPAPDAEPYLIRHGAGYSRFQHHSDGLKQSLEIFVAPDAPVKIVRLRLENTWNRPRRITATYYAEWVLGSNRSASQAYILSEFDHDSGALLAHNPYHAEFGERVAFLAGSKFPHGLTADRAEFLGRMGRLDHPAALGRIGLASRVEAGVDPCAALQLHIDLQAGATEDVFFLIGQETSKAKALELIQRYQDPAQVEATRQAVDTFWDRLLGAVMVQTPDAAMNLMLNRWLLYQTLTCRLWGRTGFYQSSGAFGFRDQLQDVMGVIHAEPALTRAHILDAARHQFEAGDVLHWWHPPSDRGIRTRMSDDMLWLPFVTAHYIETTGDTAILQEQVPFVRGDPLKADELEHYAQFATTSDSASLYEHCLRAIRRGSTAGVHGLPLMGTGDWNDGMNRIGAAGHGETVWGGWFLYSVLTRFAPFCELLGNTVEANTLRQQAQALKSALETQAWDGHWYRRAYDDEGMPLGSAQNQDCQIDSIAQSWSVLSGAGDPDHAQQAMTAVAERLLREDDQLLLLLTPPFDKSSRDPGYIKGYPPGIRENGGQYTHAALWAVWAFAELGQGNGADALFRMLNPISHSDTPEKARRYKVEPYVVAADIYSVAPHVGRGGWTWYTGSASWMYRLGIEVMLGLKRIGNTLKIDPCIPSNWTQHEVVYRDGETTYVIHVNNPHEANRGVVQTTLDGNLVAEGRIPLSKDARQHDVQVQLGHL